MSSMEHANKKQKFSPKNYYNGRIKRRQFLESGMRGFLATCNFREKEAIRESYNILNQYADDLYGEEDQKIAPTKDTEGELKVDNTEDVDELDINDALDKNINAKKIQRDEKTGLNKSASKRRFQAVDTGANNCIFIQTTLTDPAELAKNIVEDIIKTQEQKTRFLLRLVPIEVVCRAKMTDIVAAAGKLFDKYFMKEPATFNVVVNKRYNNNVQREVIIGELAKIVGFKNIGNTVDLKQAQKTVLVEVIKGLCCIAVVDSYLQNKKYNLLELANPKKVDPESKEKDDIEAQEKDGIDAQEKDDIDAQEKDDDAKEKEVSE